MNNVFKEYFRQRYSTQLPTPAKGNTVLIIEGKKAFEDYYSVFNSDSICKEIDEFSLSGYQKMDPMAYLGDFKRSGFPTSRSGDPASVLSTGFVFRVG